MSHDIISTRIDPFPYLHIRPEQGWVNDPNGIGHWDGRWQVFFQYNPDAPTHEAICWGHVSSADLITWREEPVALRPRPGSLDAAGVWSGVATTGEDGSPVLVYTAVPDVAGNAGVALAHRAEDGSWVAQDRWAAARPAEETIGDVRDPFLFTVDGRRYALLGAGRTDGTPLVLIYDATDLEDWVLLGPFLDASDTLATDLAPAQIWECPQLVSLPDDDGHPRWVLILSLWHSGGHDDLRGVSALIGEVDTAGGYPQFVTRTGHPLDVGPDFYAPQAYDAGDRVLLWGWAREGRGVSGRSETEIAESGWSGALTFPRVLGLAGETVTSAPAPELAALRRAEVPAEPGAAVPVAAAAWEAEGEGPLSVGLAGPDGIREVWSTGAAGTGQVRVLVDGSLLEVFAGGVAHTVRAYPGEGETWVLQTAGPGSDLTVWEVWELALPTP